MLVEYTCQGGTHTEERWAPNESFWTPPGGGTGGTGGTPTTTTATTVPGAPAGAHLLIDEVPTTLKSATDLSCLAVQDNGSFSFEAADSELCQFFIPKTAVIGGPGIILRRVEDETMCMGRVASGVGIVSCADPLALWVDQVEADGLRFRLSPAGLLNKCLTRSSNNLFLNDQCNAGTYSATSLFYDKAIPVPAGTGFGELESPGTRVTLIRPDGNAVVVEVVKTGFRLYPVFKVLGSGSAVGVFLTVLAQDGGIGSGLKRHEVFPNIFSQNGVQSQKRNAVEKSMPDSKKAKCYALTVDRLGSAVEGPDAPVWPDIWSSYGVSGPTNQTTIAAMFYCWKNKGEVGWRSGVAMAASRGGYMPDLPGDLLPLDPTIRNNPGQNNGTYDAERKLLSWALGVTKEDTVGVATITHSGLVPTCPQCSGAIKLFNDKRKFITLDNPESSFFFKRDPYQAVGYVL
jgi:hypothetical protein